MISSSILTETEKEVINKKLNNEKLTKQDSYYLTTSIRPKLKQMEELVRKNTLNRIGYNKKSNYIEKEIIKLINKEIKEVKAIVLYGSAVQTNYSEYKDIDLLILTKDKIYENNYQKMNLLNELEDKAEKIGLILDIQILDIQTFKKVYPSNLSLIYQMKDSKVIYGKVKIPNKIELSKMNLRMKMDWSEVNNNSEGEEIYNCIRNTILVRLILDRVIDNFYLSNKLIEELGKNLILNLKENKASKIEIQIAINYLNKINSETLNKINEEKWERLVI